MKNSFPMPAICILAAIMLSGCSTEIHRFEIYRSFDAYADLLQKGGSSASINQQLSSPEAKSAFLRNIFIEVENYKLGYAWKADRIALVLRDLDSNQTLAASDLTAVKEAISGKLVREYQTSAEIESQAITIYRGIGISIPSEVIQHSGKRTISVTPDFLDLIGKQKLAEIRQTYAIKEIDVAIVRDRQSVDVSTPANTNPSDAFASIGVARYIDRAQNPTATGALGAASLGAILGSAFDEKANKRYMLRYGLQYPDGSVKPWTTSSSDALGPALGTCVEIPSMNEAPNELCDRKSYVDYLRKLLPKTD